MNEPDGSAPRRQPTPRAATRTRWGDRRGRRADILAAAAETIAEDGYLSLNVRDVAARAGVSAGTLYSYFANKEELFATVYASAIRAHTESFRPESAAGHDLTTLLQRIIVHHVELYRRFGQHLTTWSALRHEPGGAGGAFPVELIADLRSASREHNRLMMSSVAAAAQRDGRRLVDEGLTASFLWSTLHGLADHVTSERRTLDPFPTAELIAFAARRLAVAVTVAAASDTAGDQGDPARKGRSVDTPGRRARTAPPLV